MFLHYLFCFKNSTAGGGTGPHVITGVMVYRWTSVKIRAITYEKSAVMSTQEKARQKLKSDKSILSYDFSVEETLQLLIRL
jgi:hypothetical protein